MHVELLLTFDVSFRRAIVVLERWWDSDTPFEQERLCDVIGQRVFSDPITRIESVLIFSLLRPVVSLLLEVSCSQMIQRKHFIALDTLMMATYQIPVTLILIGNGVAKSQPKISQSARGVLHAHGWALSS